MCVCFSLLEMMLESSLSDLRESQGVSLPFCPSLVRLLRLLQDFLFSEGTDNHALWSEKVSLGHKSVNQCADRSWFSQLDAPSSSS